MWKIHSLGRAKTVDQPIYAFVIILCITSNLGLASCNIFCNYVSTKRKQFKSIEINSTWMLYILIQKHLIGSCRVIFNFGFTLNAITIFILDSKTPVLYHLYQTRWNLLKRWQPDEIKKDFQVTPEKCHSLSILR